MFSHALKKILTELEKTYNHKKRLTQQSELLFRIT